MKISHHKYSKPFKRKIVVENATWTWRIAGSNVWVRTPNGFYTIATNAYELNLTTSEDWHNDNRPEDGSMDFPMCPQVTPGDIKRMIICPLAKQLKV